MAQAFSQIIRQNDCSYSRNYDVLEDDQKHVLSDFYDNGMNSTAKDIRETMMTSDDEVGTSYDKVKVS